MTKVDVSVKNLIRNVESDISNIEIRRKAIVDMSEQLVLLTKHGSECQILMLLNYIRVDISKQKDYCHKYITIRLTYKKYSQLLLSNRILKRNYLQNTLKNY